MPRDHRENDSFLFIHCPPTGQGPKASPKDMTAILRHVQDRVRRKRDKSSPLPDVLLEEIANDNKRASSISTGSKMITISLKTMKAKTRRSVRKTHRSSTFSKTRTRTEIICSKSFKHIDKRSKSDEMTEKLPLSFQRTLDQSLERKICTDLPLEPSSDPNQHTLILQNYLQNIIPKMFPIRHTAEKHCQWVVQHALRSLPLTYAVMAVSSANIWNTTQRLGFPISPPNPFAYKSKAIKLLRSGLEDHSITSEVLAFSVMCLAMTENVNGDFQAMRAHSIALQGILQCRMSSLEDMPSHALEMALTSNYVYNTITGGSPIPPPLQRMAMASIDTYANFAKTLKKLPRLACVGQAFYEPEITALLGTTLASLYHDLRTFFLWREYHHLNGTEPSSSEVDFFHALHWRSHYKAVQLLHEGELRHNGRQEALCVGLLIFRASAYQVIRPGTILFCHLSTLLIHSLESSDIHSWCMESRDQALQLIWLLLLGAVITREQSEHQWFLDTLVSILHCTGIDSNWSEMQGEIKRFLYLDRIFRVVFESTWKWVSKT